MATDAYRRMMDKTLRGLGIWAVVFAVLTVLGKSLSLNFPKRFDPYLFWYYGGICALLLLILIVLFCLDRFRWSKIDIG